MHDFGYMCNESKKTGFSIGHTTFLFYFFCLFVCFFAMTQGTVTGLVYLSERIKVFVLCVLCCLWNVSACKLKLIV